MIEAGAHQTLADVFAAPVLTPSAPDHGLATQVVFAR